MAAKEDCVNKQEEHPRAHAISPVTSAHSSSRRLEDSDVRLPIFEERKSDDRIQGEINKSCTKMTIWPVKTKVKVLMFLNLVVLDLVYTK